MAGVLFSLVPGQVTLVAATARTVVQIIAPTNQRVLLKQLEIYGNSTSGSATPVYGRLLVQTSAGTMSSLTPSKHNAADDETIQSTASHTATVEPSASTVKRTFFFHPQAGLIMPFPPGQEIPIIGGTRLGLELTSVEGATVTPTILCEE